MAAAGLGFLMLIFKFQVLESFRSLEMEMFKISEYLKFLMGWRVAITVGFDATFVVRSLASLEPVEKLYLLRALTGTENDYRSEAIAKNIAKMLGDRGVLVAVDLRDLPTALFRVAELDFDTAVLAGGPRLLGIVLFTVAIIKGSRIYVMPEYGDVVVDITGMSAIKALHHTRSEKRLEILSAMDGKMRYTELAKRVGLDHTTVFKHLQKLEEAGLVSRVDRKGGEFEADRLVTTLAKILLAYGKAASLKEPVS